MYRNRWIITVLIFSVLVVGLADVAVAKKKKADGRALYVEFCKPCHTEDSENGHYTPMTLIQDQWDRFFDEKYEPTHSEVMWPDHGDQPVTEIVSENDLEAIKKFAIKGAADSEHPMTCG